MSSTRRFVFSTVPCPSATRTPSLVTTIRLLTATPRFVEVHLLVGEDAFGDARRDADRSATCRAGRPAITANARNAAFITLSIAVKSGPRCSAPGFE